MSNVALVYSVPRRCAVKLRHLRFATGLVSALLAVPILVSSGRADDQKQKDESRLTPESRIVIQRLVGSEFAKVVRPLPASKKGFKIKVAESFDEAALRQALAQNGIADQIGDVVQITKIGFNDQAVEVDINGGGKVKSKWWRNIQIGMGGGTVSPAPPAPIKPGGATLILEFGRPLPDMTPDEFKAILSVFLDFSKQRSAATQWLDTLLPEFKRAISKKKVIVGMDEEMVVAAMGRRGDHITGAKNEESGIEEITWQYGEPPGVTRFIIFAGGKVIKVTTCSPNCIDGMPEN